MRAEEPKPGVPTQPSLTASCAIDPDDPSQYVISYSGSGFLPMACPCDSSPVLLAAHVSSNQIDLPCVPQGTPPKL